MGFLKFIKTYINRQTFGFSFLISKGIGNIGVDNTTTIYAGYKGEVIVFFFAMEFFIPTRKITTESTEDFVNNLLKGMSNINDAHSPQAEVKH